MNVIGMTRTIELLLFIAASIQAELADQDITLTSQSVMQASFKASCRVFQLTPDQLISINQKTNPPNSVERH